MQTQSKPFDKPFHSYLGQSKLEIHKVVSYSELECLTKKFPLTNDSIVGLAYSIAELSDFLGSDNSVMSLSIEEVVC